MFKSQMTPGDLAQLTGYSPQTINKWVHAQRWQTRKIKGVKGGKAHVIIISDPVRLFIINTSKMRKRYPELSRAEEPHVPYGSVQDNVERQMTEAIRAMSESEQRRLAALLLREGVTGLLSKLGIGDAS